MSNITQNYMQQSQCVPYCAYILGDYQIQLLQILFIQLLHFLFINCLNIKFNLISFFIEVIIRELQGFQIHSNVQIYNYLMNFTNHTASSSMEIQVQSPNLNNVRQDKMKNQAFELVTLKNIWNQTSQMHQQCLCQRKELYSLQQIQFCYKCGKMFHRYCYWINDRQKRYQCPFCFLKNCLPDSKVMSFLSIDIIPINKQYFPYYQVFYDLPLMFYNNLKVQVRCIKLIQQKMFKYTLCWPDHCIVSSNNKESIQIKPVNNTSPLQRRYDDPINLSSKFLKSKKNRLHINIKGTDKQKVKKSSESPYIMSIALVSSLKYQQICRQIGQRRITKQQSLNLLAKSFQTNNLTITSIVISGLCQFSGRFIKKPARSINCNHFQPFDAWNFIVASISAKSSSRKWKCPICNQRAYDVVIDSYLQLIMQTGNVKQIIFQEKGRTPIIHYQEESLDSDSCSSLKNHNKDLNLQNNSQKQSFRELMYLKKDTVQNSQILIQSNITDSDALSVQSSEVIEVMSPDLALKSVNYLTPSEY